MSHRGFTLVEMIMVMVILGIVATGVTSFLRFGTLIFIDVSERDELLSTSRFVVQRLNRELRMAVPNSVRESQSGTTQCLEFLPAVTSTFYDVLPVNPQSSDEIEAIYPSEYNSGGTQYAIVYPLSAADIYDPSNNKIFAIDEVGTNAAPLPVTITLQNAASFALHSPARRLYIARTPVSYCVRSGSLYRYADYGLLVDQSVSVVELGAGSLMGEHLVNDMLNEQPFELTPASLVRNAYVSILLRFAVNDEIVDFNNEVHIPNAP
ncbi:type II secretion system protein [Alteromonadaceae bacterium BrNp21-10]|nr:type II secretion system protein [Alteromonadaceae bacterium BrNp21-10]